MNNYGRDLPFVKAGKPVLTTKNSRFPGAPQHAFRFRVKKWLR
jgi:hypothetical protein